MANSPLNPATTLATPSPHIPSKSTDLHVVSPTEAGVCFAMGLLALGVSAAILYKRLAVAGWLRCHPLTHWWVKVVEWVIALVGAALGEYFEVFKFVSWSNPDGHLYSAVFAVLSFGILFVATGHVRDGVKDSAEETIKELEQSVWNYKRQRDAWVRLSVHIRNIIDKKMKRVAALAKSGEVSKEGFLGALSPDEQVMLILQSIYEFFRFELHQKRPDAKLRLGLYMRDQQNARLSVEYSWDGTKKDCMSANPKQMELASPDGVGSVIVQCYNMKGDCCIHIVADCLHEAGFDFFRPEQKAYLKSMVAFKYRTEHNGTADALVLALDCDEPNFFNQDQSEELKTFLIEMMKRIDYELVISEAATKVAPKP